MAITTVERVKTYNGITDTSQDTFIEFMIPLVEDEILAYRNRPWEIDSEGKNIYPSGAELVAIKLISLELDTQGQGVSKKSESLDGYSVSMSTPEEQRTAIIEGSGSIKRYGCFL